MNEFRTNGNVASSRSDAVGRKKKKKKYVTATTCNIKKYFAKNQLTHALRRINRKLTRCCVDGDVYRRRQWRMLRKSSATTVIRFYVRRLQPIFRENDHTMTRRQTITSPESTRSQTDTHLECRQWSRILRKLQISWSLKGYIYFPSQRCRTSLRRRSIMSVPSQTVMTSRYFFLDGVIFHNFPPPLIQALPFRSLLSEERA